MSVRRPLTPVLAGLAVLAAAAGAATTAFAAPDAACPRTTLQFGEPQYVDTSRAGGEPIVFTYPNGRVLYGSHAGTTHFYAPDAGSTTTGSFADHYEGQTYYWWSDTQGGEWTFADRTAPPDNAPMTGFSDPEFAYDTAGNVYVSEINLANVAVSKSTDGGKTYKLQNPTANIFTDRQWTEGDTENVVYLVANPTGPGGTFSPGQTGYQVNSGHTMYKSVDGGKTWTPGFKDANGLGDIRVDKRNGTVYEAHLSGTEFSIAAFRNARGNDFKTLVEPDVGLVDDDVHMLSHWPAFDLDPDGNLYVVWDETGAGDRDAGVYYSYSTDAGRHFATPVRVDGDDKTDIWPWIGVGDDGKVGIAWLEADKKLPGENAETTGDYGWRVVGATTVTGLGCGGQPPKFTRAVMTKDPMHTGTVCMGGTACQATATDRRLGDYFSVEVDGKGMMYAGYSDTRKGGSVSLPAFVRQTGGTPLVGGASVKPPKGPKAKPPATVTEPRTAPTTLPTTGAGLALPAVAGIAGLTAYAAVRRRRRSV
jgi:hypothetical protein